MALAAASVEGVTLVDLYAEYPTFDVQVEREQQRLLEHDVVVFLHPLYWYSTPALLKEWQDLVLEHGFAYGSSGKSLHGKWFLSALSAGGPESAYRREGYNQFSIRELLYPLEQMAHLCGMPYLPPFALFGARTAVREGRLGDHVERWCQLLGALRDGRFDVERARTLEHLAPHLTDLIDSDGEPDAGATMKERA